SPKSHRARSKAPTAGPMMYWPLAATSIRAASMAGPMRRRWLRRSMKGMVTRLLRGGNGDQVGLGSGQTGPVVGVRRRARAEDGLSDAHHGRAFAHRQFVVAGHAHRQAGDARVDALGLV